MRIGIDASKLSASVKTGVEFYTENLIRALLKLDKDDEYILYSYNKLPDEFAEYERVMPFMGGRGWTRGRLSWEMLVNSPDVLLSPANRLPLVLPERAVAVIHDVGFLKFSRNYLPRQLRYLKKATEFALKEASVLIISSQSTLRDIKKYYSWVDESKLNMIYPGIDAERFARKCDISELPKVVRKYAGKYFFFIGRLDYRKNIKRLVRAFDKFKENNSQIRLVLAGVPGIGYRAIEETIGRAKHKNDIIELGYVSEKSMPALYQHAAALTFPTLYEGFGFPILEAYASYTPVLAGNNSSQPELAGNLGVLVDAKSIDNIAVGMNKILCSKTDTIEYDKIVSKFDWINTAQQVYNLLCKTKQ